MADPTTPLAAPSTLVDLNRAVAVARPVDLAVDLTETYDAAGERRQALKSRHTLALGKLLEERDDLRGVHPLADLVADSLRWSA